MENNVSQLEEKRARFKRSAISIVDRAIREVRPLRPAEEADVDGLEAKLGAIDRTLGRHSKYNSDDSVAPGTFVHCMISLLGSRGNREIALERAEARGWPDAVRALSAGVATAGGFAVPMGFVSDVIQALRASVSVRKLGPTLIPMSSGNLFWPRVNVGGSVGYIHEGAVISASQETFGAVSLMARKLAALTPISNSLLRSSSPAADVIVKEDLVAALSATEDMALLRGDGANDTPKGIRNWAPLANVFTAPALSGTILGSADVASVDASLSQLELALVSAGIRMTRPGWILSPRTALNLKSLRGTSGERAFPELTAGMLRGYPVAISSNQPINLVATPSGGSQSASCSEIVLCDFSYVVLGEAGLVIDVSGQGTYTDSNGSMVSAFSQDSSLVRVVLQSDIGMRRDEAVAVLTAVAY